MKPPTTAMTLSPSNNRGRWQQRPFFMVGKTKGGGFNDQIRIFVCCGPGCRSCDVMYRNRIKNLGRPQGRLFLWSNEFSHELVKF
jgi:hypothetical protein